MNRLLFGILILLLFTGGCNSVLSLRKHPKTMQEYALSHITAPPSATRQKLPAVLLVSSASAPSWLEGRDFYYRLAYAAQQNFQPYSGSRWAAPVAELLTQRLRNYLAAYGPFSGVLSPEDGAKADYALRLNLEDFSQVFTSPQNSRGRVRARVTLINMTNYKVIAQKTFQSEIPALSPNAAGGAVALDQASLRLTQQIQQWLGTLAPRLSS